MNDVDLHVVTPSGEFINFRTRRSRCGGELDVDANVQPETTEPVENIFWPTGGAPRGKYRVAVNLYRSHVPTLKPTPFIVMILIQGQQQVFKGMVSPADPWEVVHQFEIKEFLPPSALSGEDFPLE